MRIPSFKFKFAIHFYSLCLRKKELPFLHWSKSVPYLPFCPSRPGSDRQLRPYILNPPNTYLLKSLTSSRQSNVFRSWRDSPPCHPPVHTQAQFRGVHHTIRVTCQRSIMAFSRYSVIRMLSQSYIESRNIEKTRNMWTPAFHREMSQHLDLIKEGIKGFSRLHADIVSFLTASMGEGDERADLCIRRALDELFPARALDLVSQIDQLLEHCPSQVAPEAVMVCADDDLRSFTVDLEPGPSNHRQGESSMGPPPRPVAFLTPETPAGPRHNVDEGTHEPPPIREDRDSLTSDTTHGSHALMQTAKRTLDVAEIDHPHTPELPTKKAKSSTAQQLDGLVTKSVDFREVEGKQFIFKGSRYGDGRFVLRCGSGQRKPFLKHPLWAKVAMNHFNSDGHPCHDTSRNYTLEDVLIEYTYHGKDIGLQG